MMEVVWKDLRYSIGQMMSNEENEEHKIEIEGNSEKGEGFMGEITFFKISSTKGQRMQHLVMKSLTKSLKRREIMSVERCFEREFYMYNTIIPLLRKFVSMEEDSIQYLEFIPKLYWSSREYMKEILILEDLKSQGYRPRAMMEPLDFEHTQIVVNTLAKWHGVVMAYRDQNKEHFLKLLPELNDLRDTLSMDSKQSYTYLRKYIEKVSNLMENRGYKKLSDKYREANENLEQFLQQPNDNDDLLVISHGDVWLNNIMFKYEVGEEKPCGVKLLDYQISSCNSPVADLSFFIYGCCDRKGLDNFDILIDQYYETLSTTINNLGSNSAKVFTLKQLQEHWRKYGLYGVAWTMASLQCQFITKEELPDIETEGVMAMNDMTLKNDKKYYERALEVFLHYGDKYLESQIMLPKKNTVSS